MRYTGQAISCNPSYRVTGAVVTDTKVSIDWDENGVTGHLEAVSTDGVTFSGNYGYTALHPDSRVIFTRYRNKNGGLLLIGPWHYKDGSEGEWAIRLEPADG